MPKIYIYKIYIYTYRKFSNKGASPNKGAPCFLRGARTQNSTFLAISQPKIVRFSFCKKPLEADNALYFVISLLPRPAPLLENLRYLAQNPTWNVDCGLSCPPSLVHSSRGRGWPLAMHLNSTSSPTVASMYRGSIRTVGASAPPSKTVSFFVNFVEFRVT